MKYSRSLDLNVPASYAFKWHEQPGALARLLPPWEDIEIHSRTGGIQHGDRVEMSVSIGPARKRWVAEHRDYIADREFTDVQLQGPFARWTHRHRFEPVTETSCRLHDEIEYELPLGSLGKALGASHVEQKLNTMFRFRHERTKADVEQHYRYHLQPRQKVLISGSTGMIGTALTAFLAMGGHEIYRLVRDEDQARINPNAIYWDIKKGEIERKALEGFDTVIHLAGANIAGHRWTRSYKETIKNSRVKSTQLLSSLLATLSHKPKVLISTSAVGFYGDRGAEILTEQTTSGLGFLPEVARAWEEAADPARQAGIRVVHPRLGIVLSPEGGALQAMIKPFRWGVGGVVGSGQQYWPAISLDDVIGVFYKCMMEEQLSGPVNVVMPEPLTNRQFTKTLGAVLNRPTITPIPAFGIKLLMGEMGEALLLHSNRVIPEKLLQADFHFRHPDLKSALQFQLGRFPNSDISS